MTLRLRTTFLAGAMASATLLLSSAPLGAQAVVQALPPPALADLAHDLAAVAPAQARRRHGNGLLECDAEGYMRRREASIRWVGA